MDLLEIALSYAHRGWPVFPLEPRAKRPLGRLVAHGLHDAAMDEDVIRHWWEAEPEANIGLRCGVAFDVVDLDSEEAIKRFQALAREHGTDLSPFPRAQTGGGGRHVYVAPTGLGNRAGVISGLDWRGIGGYVVAPGSVHSSGATYTWKRAPDEGFPSAPEWLLELLQKDEVPERTIGHDDQPPETYVRRALEEEIRELRKAQKGQRNNRLNQAAFSLGQLVGTGALSRHMVEAELTAAAYSIELSPREAKTTIRSGLNAGERDPRQPPAEGWNSLTSGRLTIGGRLPGQPEDGGAPDSLRSVGYRDTTWYLHFPGYGQLELTTHQLREWRLIEMAFMEAFNRLPKWNPRRPQEAWRDLLRELMDSEPPREEAITSLTRNGLITQEIRRYCTTAWDEELIVVKRGNPCRSTEHDAYVLRASGLTHYLSSLVRPAPSIREVHNIVREHLGGRQQRLRLPEDEQPTRVLMIPLATIEEEDE